MYLNLSILYFWLPWWLNGKESATNSGDSDSIPGLGRSRRAWQLTPIYLPEKSHGQRSLTGHSLWGCKVLHTTWWLSARTHERTHTHTHTHTLFLPLIFIPWKMFPTQIRNVSDPKFYFRRISKSQHYLETWYPFHFQMVGNLSSWLLHTQYQVHC